jgi:polysaccharide biosynthesis transport protein
VATLNRHGTGSDGTIVPTLLDYLRVVGRRKLLFLLIVLLVPATAVAVSLTQAPTYRASAEVLLRTPDSVAGAQQTFIDPARVAQTRADLARVPAVVDRTLAEVPSAGLDRTEFLESSTVSTTLGSDFLTFSVENSDPQLAIQLATEYAHAFTDYQQELETRDLEGALAGIRQQLADLVREDATDTPVYEALQEQEQQLAALAAAHTPSAQVVREADEAPKAGPRTVRNGAIAFCLGLVLAIIIVFLADALDTRVRSVDAIREALGLRLLGRLSAPPSRLRNGKGLVMLADPTSRGAEQFRALRASLDLANAEYGARALMITSAVDAEGKSTTAANLAVALARAGRRVVLIEGDVGDPQLHRLFSLDRRPGLTEVELGEAKLAEALRPIGLTDDLSGTDDSSRRLERAGSLEVLPGGSVLQDPDELGFERAVGKIIKRVRGQADVVLVDAPPLLRGHAIALSAHVDALVVIVRLKALRTSALHDLGWMLEASPATKLGFVLTGVIEKSERDSQHQRHAASNAKPTKPTLTGAPSTNGHGDAPTQARSKSARRPFGGLSPREAAQRSAQSRRAKSAQRAEAAKRAADDESKDALEDA